MRFNARRGLIAASALQVGGGGGPSTTNFDPSNTGTFLTLSGGNLIATANTTSNTPNASMARSVTSHSTGKFHAEFALGGTVGSFQIAIGVANASQAVTTTDSTRIGNNANGICLYSGVGQIWTNGSDVLSSAPAANSGDVVVMEVDAGAALIWFNVNGGNWNGSGTANPATGVGGVSISVAGALFAAADISNDAASVGSVTANFGGSAYAHSPSSGFGNW